MLPGVNEVGNWGHLNTMHVETNWRLTAKSVGFNLFWRSRLAMGRTTALTSGHVMSSVQVRTRMNSLCTFRDLIMTPLKFTGVVMRSRKAENTSMELAVI